MSGPGDAPPPAHHVRVTVACPAAANALELTAALALELEGTTWAIATMPADDDLVVTVSAEPCAVDAPLAIAAAHAPGGSSMRMDGVYLPATARTRALALLVAELVTFDSPPPAAAPPPPPPPAITPPAREPDLAEEAVAADAPEPWSTRHLELELAATRRYYNYTSAPGNGLRLAAGMAVHPTTPWLRARLDLAAIDFHSGYGVELRGIHLGAAVLARKQWIAAFQVEVGLRGEGQVSFAHPRELGIRPEYLYAYSAGAIAGLNFRLSANLRLRVEAEAAVLATRATVTVIDPASTFGVDYPIKILSPSASVTIGIVVL